MMTAFKLVELLVIGCLMSTRKKKYFIGSLSISYVLFLDMIIRYKLLSVIAVPLWSCVHHGNCGVVVYSGSSYANKRNCYCA